MTNRRNTTVKTSEVEPIGEMDDDAVLGELRQLIQEAGQDERRVALYILRRFVRLGRDCYDELHIASDTRDGFVETSEELADGLFYLSFAFLKKQMRP